MDQHEGLDSCKKRIRIACDTCRRKKIKCNGQLPCGNCVQVGELNCRYAERPAKKKPQKPPSQKPKKSHKLSNAKSLQVIDSRLLSLESVLSRLTYKLDLLDPNPDSKSPQYNHQQSMFYKDEDTASETDDNDDDEEEDNEDNDESNEDSVSQQNGGLIEADLFPTPKKLNLLSDTTIAKDLSRSMLNSKNMEQYFGTHSIMSIFSHKSMDWIEQTLGPEGVELTLPIRNLPFLFLNLFKTFMMKWVDPPLVDYKERKRLLESPFPTDSRFVYDFIDKYYANIPMVSLVQDSTDMRGLFEDYYKNFDPRTPTRSKRKFKYSEYLMMTMTLLMVIGSKIDQDQTNQATTPTKVYKEDKTNALNSYSNDELIALQSTLFDNAVYYYHRISVISDGIETIQAILMMIIYIESNLFVSHINYSIIGVAVRFAQEMGLHRSETYDILDFEQQGKRRKIWWLCHYYDMEICFRNGKPPLINIADVTTNNSEDLEYLSLLWAKRKGGGPDDEFGSAKCHALSKLGTIEQLSLFCQGDDPTAFYYVYLLLLTKLRANSYNALFMASARNESYETLTAKLDALNKEMFELAESMHGDDRPRFFNDPKFRFIPDNVPLPRRESILAVQLTYFLHLMLINRLCCVTSSEYHVNEKNIEFRNISLNAARTILVLVKQINKTNTVITYFNWLLFFPVSAFLTISASLLNNPEAPEAYKDLELLVDCTQNFFGSENNWVIFEQSSTPRLHSQKDAVLLLLTKLILRINIRFYERKMGVSLPESTATLDKHLQDAKLRYPEVFKVHKKNDVGEPIVFGASPFGNGKQVYGKASSTYSSSSRTTMSQSPTFAPSLTNILHPCNETTGDRHGSSLPPLPNHSPAAVSPGWAYSGLGNANSSLAPEHQQFMAQTSLPPLQSPRQSAHYAGVHHSHDSPGKNYSNRRGTIGSAIGGYIPGHEGVIPCVGNTNGEGIAPGIGGSNELHADYLNDDALTLMFFSQMNSLPNFFFDHGLGVEQ